MEEARLPSRALGVAGVRLFAYNANTLRLGVTGSRKIRGVGMETTGQAKGKAEAHVKLGDDERIIPAGDTVVSFLKAELGVDPAVTLFLMVGGKRTPLANDQVIDVRSGMHFEAIGGGGVS